MSLINRMKMSCSIYRSTPSVDSYGNTELSWSLVSSGIKCYIHQFEQSYGKYYVRLSGVEIDNRYIAYFKPGTDVVSGDKLSCSSFSNLEFYVVFPTPIIRPQTGKVHHIEAVLQLNPT